MELDKISFEAYKKPKVRSPYKFEKDKLLKEKIKKASKAIRKKYLALKLGKAEEDETINRLLKPVIDPLQELKSINVAKKRSVSVGGDRKEALKFKQYEKEDDSLFEEALNIKQEYEQEDDSLFEDTFETINLNQYPFLARSYIRELYNRSKGCDTTYGIRFDNTTNKLYIGNTEVHFGSNGGISIDNKMYSGKKGLYDLLFMKNPKDYDEQDLNDYKEILQTSSAHKRNYDSSSQINGTRSFKYIDIIKPLFKKTKPTPSGSGVNSMIYNEKPIEYIYWDDVNELVDRLRLLNASKAAGNTYSHDNEILAIINELREAKVIY